jgi:hypothetical protein
MLYQKVRSLEENARASMRSNSQNFEKVEEAE